MNRPFYVHTPKNFYGEHLTICPWSIRSVFEPRKDLRLYSNGLGLKYAEDECKQMNDRHEAELMAGMI
jgi:hypothetical protein